MVRTALLASVSALALLSANDLKAADLYTKARPVIAAPAPIYSWTGCYVGAQIGYGRGRNSHTGTNSSNNFLKASGRVDTGGGLFGGQVGCNYQFSSNWVVGIQYDIAGTNFTGRADDEASRIFDFDTRRSVAVKTDWLSSVTGRLGYTIYNNQGLLYVKGGGAWVRNTWDLSNTGADYGTSVASETRSGGTVGVGLEWKFTQNWSGFAEFNYYEFGGSKLLAQEFNRTFVTNKQEIETFKIGVNYSLF